MQSVAFGCERRKEEGKHDESDAVSRGTSAYLCGPLYVCDDSLAFNVRALLPQLFRRAVAIARSSR
eukprot:1176681-Prorocentrum_minimum.AAC.2